MPELHSILKFVTVLRQSVILLFTLPAAFSLMARTAAQPQDFSQDSLIVSAYQLVRKDQLDSATHLLDYLDAQTTPSLKQSFRKKVLRAFLLLEQDEIPDALFQFKQTLLDYEGLDDPKFMAYLHYGLGIAYKNIENSGSSQYHYDQAILKYQEADDPFMASDVASEYGLGVMFRSDYLEATRYFTQAMGLIIAQDTSRNEAQYYLPQLFMNLALASNGLNDKELAIAHAKKAIHYGHRMNHRNVPSYYATLGAVYRGMGDLDTALKAYKKSLIIAQNRSFERSIRMALSNIARTFSMQGELDSAIHYLRNANQIDQVSNFHLQNFNVDLARYYQQANQTDSAIYFAKQAVVYAKEISNYRIQRDAYQLLSASYQTLGDATQALSYEKAYKTASDSIMVQASAREYDQLKVKLQTLDKEYELAKLNDEMSTQKQLSLYLLLLVLVAIVALFFIVKYWLSERKRKNIEIDNILVSKKSIEKDLKSSQQDLADSAVRLLAQQQFLEELEHTVQASARGNQAIDTSTVRQIDKAIRLNKVNTDDWETFITNFGNAHGDFFQKLKSAYPNLTSGELKHCALLKMNFSVKQAAQLLGVDQKSVTMARYRLKKKMNLDGETNVHEVIFKF